MPSKDAHLAAAKANQNAIDYLLVRIKDFPGWTITIAFYKALHIVEALFAVDGQEVAQHTDSHEERNSLLKKTKRYQQIWIFYRKLYQASLIARYLQEDEKGKDCEVFSKYMPPEDVKQLALGHWLLQIQKSAATLTGDAAFKV
jgi:hypothetical protein